ncbi:MAG: glycosyltransferase family 4 protein [Clostridiales bacterium]|nr:glycosyltransferase family 4 protein [Clostridiales bacterium]
MRILVINADCLSVNSSANLCHLAYIQGLVDLGCKVDVLSADGRDYQLDHTMTLPQGVKSFTYYGVSLYEKASLWKKRDEGMQSALEIPRNEKQNKENFLRRFARRTKKFLLNAYGPHGIYSTFARKAQAFRSDVEYDYVLSVSTPPASHLLAHNLLQAGHIKAKQWIQIWEDPWYSDAYGFNGKKAIHDEERRLLSFAQRVCYVSPLTLKNQQRLYPESAHKMYWQPLPYYYKGETAHERIFEKNAYGYFGDYVPAARDLAPFYQAAKETGVEVNICGNPSNLFESTEQIHIYPRMPLDKLKEIEDKTNVLIFLCNRKGGQIPGKIYQYSATNKVILFILDGTEEEKEVLRAYFEPFNRYVFCENTAEDIARALRWIENGDFGSVKNEPIEDFNPTETIRKILEA